MFEAVAEDVDAVTERIHGEEEARADGLCLGFVAFLDMHGWLSCWSFVKCLPHRVRFGGIWQLWRTVGVAMGERWARAG